MRQENLWGLLSLAAAAMTSMSAPLAGEALAQEAGSTPAPAQPAASEPAPKETSEAEPPASAVQPAPSDFRIRFNFKNAPYEQVLDFMARQTGLPVIREAEVPDAPVTFIGASDYTLAEALDILNRMLLMHGVQLRREQDFLYLSKIENMRSVGRVAVDGVPEDAGAAEVVTIVVPLENAAAATTADQIKPLISPFGQVTPLPQQNMLVIVDTAAQCRRLRDILTELDAEPPSDSQFELFPLKHAKAEVVVESLKGLVAVKKSMVIIDKDGKMKTVEENEVAGLNLQADPRTNSIIAVGPDARLRQVEQLVALLDLPEGAAENRELVTFALDSVDPARATQDLSALFAKVPEDRRPTLIPIGALAKLAIVGSAAQIEQAGALLREIDPGAAPTEGASPGSGSPETTAAVVALQHVQPQQAIAAIERLLTPRDRAGVRYTAAPSGDGVVLSGSDRQLAMLRALLEAVDAAPEVDRQVRQLSLQCDDPDAAVKRAADLYHLDDLAAREPITATWDAELGLATVVGGRSGLDRFTELLRGIDAALAIELETRTFQPQQLTPTELAERLTRTVWPLLADDAARNKTRHVEPTANGIDEAGLVVVRASPRQMAVINPMLQALDSQNSAERPPLRILRLRTTDAANLASVLSDRYARRPAEERAKKPVEITADAATNTLIVSAHTDVFPEIQSIVDELNQTQALDAEGREIRVFPLKVARAEELARVIDQMYPEPPIPVDSRGRPRPDLKQPREIVVRADPATNSLIVDAPVQRLAGFEQLVAQLDQQQVPDDLEVRTYRVKRAQLDAAASTLRQLVATKALPGTTDSGAQGAISITTEPVSRSLVVSGPREIFAGVETVLAELDAAPERPTTGLAMYPLKHARAERLQPLLERLLIAQIEKQAAEDNLDLPNPAEFLDVAADKTTNTLIISAPEFAQQVAERLINTLDLPAADAGRAVVRIVPLAYAEAAAAANTIRQALHTMDLPGGDPSAVTVAEVVSSNSILISGAEADVKKIETLLESIDVAPPASARPDGVDVRTIQLTHARAEALAPVVENLLKKESVLDQLPPWERWRVAAAAAGGGEAPQLRVAADRRLNAVVVTGPIGLTEVAEQIVRELDVAPSGDAAARTGRGGIRIFTLNNADAAQVAQNATALFAEDPAAPVIRVDAGSNSVIVRGDPEEVAAVEDLITSLDKATLSARRDVRMIPVDRSRADAAMMAEALRRLLEQRSGTKVEVIPLDRLLQKDEGAPKADDASKSSDAPKSKDNTSEGAQSPARETGRRWLPDAPASGSGRADLPILTVTTPPMKWAGEAPGDQTPPPDATLQISSFKFQVSNPRTEPPAPNSKLLTLNSKLSLLFPLILTTPQEAPAPDADDESTVIIAIDPETNSLIVVGSPILTDRIALLAAELERQMPAEPTRIRIVELPPAANAWEIARTVDVTTRQIGRANQDNPGGFTGPVSVQADPAGGALIVSANDTDFTTIGDLIAAMARPTTSASATIKVYPLTNVTASRALRSVADLISASPRGRQAQRLLELTVDGPEGPATGTIEPGTVQMTADPSDTALIVVAPAETLDLLDRFIGLLDQSPVGDRVAIRRFALENAEADDAARTLQRAFDASRQDPAMRAIPRASFVGDERTNTLLVTGTSEQLAEVERLLTTLDAPMQDAETVVEIIALQVARPSTVQRMVESVIVGRDPARRDKVQIAADDTSNLFVIRAPAEEIEEVKRIVAEADRAETTGLPVRSVKLERADAGQVATALQQFFRDRANLSPGGRRAGGGGGGVAIVGDRRTSTLVVAASDEDFAQVQSLLETFDAPSPSRDLQFKIIPLKHARVTEVRPAIENMVDEVRYPPYFWFGGRNQAPPDTMIVEFDERSNSVVVMGQGESFDTVERIVAALDQPAAEGATLAVRAVRLEHADPSIVADAIAQATATPGWTWWRGTDPGAVRAEADRRARTVVLIGREDRIKEAEGYARQLDEAATRPQQRIETIALNFSAADGVARSLERFFDDRARQAGPAGQQEAPSFIGSPDGRVLIVSASEDQLVQIRELAGQMDMPEESEGRTRQIFTLKNADAQEITRTLREQFPTGRTARTDAVIVTPQATLNAVVVSAPDALFDRVSHLIAQLDAPPSTEDTSIVTVSLEAARAEDAARALQSALPRGVKITITPVRRTNSLMLTGSQEAIDLVMEQIARLDEQPTRSPVEFRRIRLEHAVAFDLAGTLRQLLRDMPVEPGESRPAISSPRNENSLLVQGTAQQLDQIETMVNQLDVPRAGDQTTEFVPLRFADAEQTARALEVFYGPWAAIPTTPEAERVAIIGVPVSNSLVISADAKEWPGIRALIEKLDSEEYDTSRQLEIIALKYADASSLARALNEAFAAPIRAELERQRARNRGNNRGRDGGGENGPDVPTVLIDADETVTVTAERLTNSLIVSAGREDLSRIRAVVEKVDVPDFAELPEARVIPIARGVPTQLAAALREMYADLESTRGGGGGPRAVVIVGDDRSGTLIVRAEESEFARISALADTLQQEADRSLARVRVLRLTAVPAAYVAATLQTTFAPAAKQRDEPLAIAVDRLNNALVISSSEPLYKEISQVVAELEGAPGMPGPAEGQQPNPATPAPGVFIIDVENNSPEKVRELLEQMGVTRPAPTDRMGVVSEPVTIIPLHSRRALAIVASVRDAETITSLVRAIDAAPGFSDQHVEIVHLVNASAPRVAAALENLLKPGEQDTQTGAAAALAEQVRRLSIHRDAVDQPDLALDLSKPIRIYAEEQTNAVVIASTTDNVAALREITRLLDKLPVGDAVTIRFFPLQHASATRLAGVVRDLFTQGERIRRMPGSQINVEPTTQVGKALIGEIAVSVDERTNALVIAGREEAVALVEVIIGELDSADTANWIEPTVIQLKHADATRLSRKLNDILIAGVQDTPEAAALRRQVARIRVAQAGAPQGQQAVETDIFAPLTSLTILPEENLNAILVIGSTANAAAVRSLVQMLDVPAAAAANTVRVYPLKFAAADRVANMLQQIFRQQVQAGTIQKEDDLILVPDQRTNSLVISTSPSSFAVVEALLQRFDGEAMDPLVGIHVVPVPDSDVAALAPKIERLMRERLESARRAGGVPSPSDTFSVQAEPATSSLIVAASDENLKIVQELITLLAAGAETTGGSQLVDVIPAGGVRATDLVEAIRTLYVERENERRGQNAVEVTADARLNALIVRGTKNDVEAIRTLIGQLAEAPVTAVTEIKRIELTRANAADVVNLLQNVLAGRPIAGGRTIGARQAQILRFIRDQHASRLRERAEEEGIAEEGGPTQAEINGAIQEQVTLTAELRTNSVVAVAPAPLMRLIETIIADLDQTTAGGRKVEIFHLKNADARAMRDVLRDLFSLRQQGDTLVLVPGRPGADPDEIEPELDPTQLFPIPDERQALAITIDARTNSILVSATDEYLEEVRNVIQQLDSVEANEREQIVYQLRNANATEVAQTLREYFQDEADTFRQILGPDRSGSLIRLLEREVTVQGDEGSQRLIVGVSPRYRAAIDEIVAELDATPPQVMIEVLLAEVTLDESFDWGVDFEVGPIGRLDVMGGFLTAGAGITTALGVPNVSVSTADFSFMVRALEAQGRLEVLSKPQIMVNNNETANIQVGENIAIIESVDTFESGRSQANVVREDVGILLNVTPSINTDGFVRMVIKPQISNVSTRTTEISEDFQAPIISKREIDTNVTVKDGETIVIGGLIQSTLEKRDTKVPLLGDIPIAGEVFRSHQYSNLKTELLVILTPRVIRSASAHGTDRLRRIREASIEELSVPESVKAELRGENGGGANGPSQPPLEEQPGDLPGPRPQQQPAWFGPYEPGREPEGAAP